MPSRYSLPMSSRGAEPGALACRVLRAAGLLVLAACFVVISAAVALAQDTGRNVIIWDDPHGGEQRLDVGPSLPPPTAAEQAQQDEKEAQEQRLEEEQKRRLEAERDKSRLERDIAELERQIAAIDQQIADLRANRTPPDPYPNTYWYNGVYYGGLRNRDRLERDRLRRQYYRRYGYPGRSGYGDKPGFHGRPAPRAQLGGGGQHPQSAPQGRGSLPRR